MATIRLVSHASEHSLQFGIQRTCHHKVGGQAVLGRQLELPTPWLTERHGYDPTSKQPWGVWIDAVIMRANDILLAFPALLLAIIFAAVYSPGTGPAMVAVGIAAIPGFARVARSGTLQVLGSEYVRAARASNRRIPAIAVVHVLPNIAGMVIVQASVAFAISVLAEAGLSFLGLGTQAPVPSWGRMLQESQQFLSTHPELALWPGLFIALAVLGFNLLGDGLRDRFDPKMEARGV